MNAVEQWMWDAGRPLALCAGVLCAALAQAAFASPAPASAQASVSTNWAGYAAVPGPAVGSRFAGVSGAWTQPSATCARGHAAFSAVWVGLGGYNERSQALEQIGTDADCANRGTVTYHGWYELLPSAPVNLALAIRPGDRMAASVTVRRQDVTLRIEDLTSGKRFATTKRRAVIDASSAEWIVEAPSACASREACEILPLADFGQVEFSHATATVGSHTGPVADPDWFTTALELQQRTFAGGRVRDGALVAPTRTLTAATPSESATPTGAFSVSWTQQTTRMQRPSPPTLPGFGGGAP